MAAREARHATRGSLLIITLWIIAVLAAAALAAGGYLAMDTRLLRYASAQAQARQWVRAGVMAAMARLASDLQDEAPGVPEADWLGDVWAPAWTTELPMAGESTLRGTVTVTITDDERRLNVNLATEDVLTALLQDASAAQAIVAYRDAVEEPPDTGVMPPYLPKNAPIAVLEELWQVPVIETGAEFRVALAAHATAHGAGAVNINTVSEAVLLAFGGDPSVVGKLIDARPGLDAVFGTSDDCVATDVAQAAVQLAACAQVDPDALVGLLSVANAGVVASSIFRIEAEVSLERPSLRMRAVVIVDRSGASGSGPRMEIGGAHMTVMRWDEH